MRKSYDNEVQTSCCNVKMILNHFLFFCSAKMLKSYSNSRKSSPNRTPVKKQTKVQSLLDPSRLRPPPPNSIGTGPGNMLSTNTRINYSLGAGMQDQYSTQPPSQQQSRQTITLHLDENEILSIPPDSNVVWSIWPNRDRLQLALVERMRMRAHFEGIHISLQYSIAWPSTRPGNSISWWGMRETKFFSMCWHHSIDISLLRYFIWIRVCKLWAVF